MRATSGTPALLGGRQVCAGRTSSQQGTEEVPLQGRDKVDLTSSLPNSEAQQPLRPAALSGEASPLPPPHHQRLPGRAQATNEHLTEGALSRTGSSPSAPEGAKAAPPAVHHPPSRAPTARWDRGPGDTGPLHPQST